MADEGFKAREVGRVEAVLPRGQYRVALDGGRRLRAMVGREARAALFRLVPGDLVEVEPFAWDPNQGAILRRLKGAPPGGGPRRGEPPRRGGGSSDDDAESRR